mmetsp:Transcript_79262/g.227369  ORF Transcript_79262/g.227369 Transcript_79262/m.227369 type:complete len:201 (+) Transcript_79262:433-1035(+)
MRQGRRRSPRGRGANGGDGANADATDETVEKHVGLLHLPALHAPSGGQVDGVQRPLPRPQPGRDGQLEARDIVGDADIPSGSLPGEDVQRVVAVEHRHVSRVPGGEHRGPPRRGLPKVALLRQRPAAHRRRRAWGRRLRGRGARLRHTGALRPHAAQRLDPGVQIRQRSVQTSPVRRSIQTHPEMWAGGANSGGGHARTN